MQRDTSWRNIFIDTPPPASTTPAPIGKMSRFKINVLLADSGE